jgi:dTDP-4-dehydrorhamnose reductase
MIVGTHLIIGGDGLIGKALVRRLEKEGNTVFKTTRHKHPLEENEFFLDLSMDISKFEIPKGVKTAYICAANTSVARCEENPDSSSKINTIAPLALAEKLIEKEIFVIFFSSSAVFDGKYPYQKADAPLSPVRAYGKQKAATELGLRKYSDKVLIVRPTKVLSAQLPLIENWVKDLKAGKPIHPFKDLKIAPVHIDYVVDKLSAASCLRKGGILQLSGEKDISYFEFMTALAAKIQLPVQLIQPVNVARSNVKVVYAPPYTSLSTLGNLDILDAGPQLLEDVISSIKNQIDISSMEAK